MHIRAMSKPRPAPASELAFLLDAISQILSIFSTLQYMVTTVLNQVLALQTLLGK